MNIRQEDIDKYLELLKDLYTELNGTRYKSINMTNLCSKHKVPYETVEILRNQKFIVKRGKNRGAEYKWMEGRSEPQPKQAREVLEATKALVLVNAKRRAEEKEAKQLAVPAKVSEPKVEVKVEAKPEKKVTKERGPYKKKANKILETVVEEQKFRFLWGMISWSKLKTNKQDL